MNQNEPTSWHWFCISQQHRINLFCSLHGSLSNILRQLSCLLKPFLQTKHLQLLQTHFVQDTVSTFLAIFITTCLLWGFSDASHVFLSDTHTDQGHVCTVGWLPLSGFHDKHFSFKPRTMSGDPGTCVMRAFHGALGDPKVGGIFMVGL